GRISSTRTTRRSRPPCGVSTVTPSAASGASRRWSSGTTTSPSWRSCSPRPSARARPRRRCWVPTPSLRELQRAFWRSIASQPGAAAVLERVLLETVRPTPTLAPAERVHIYAGMYFWRIVEALREDFPKVATVLGADGFAELVRGYIAAHPSTEPSIRHVGHALPDFLGGYQPAYLADLARLESTRLHVFDAPDAAPVTAAAAGALLLRWVEDGIIAGASCGGAEPPARPRA